MVEWRPVVGFEGLYAVSADGQVKSLGRTTIGGSRGGHCVKHWRPRLLVPVISGGGVNRRRKYNRVNLFHDTQGSGFKKQTFYIFDLVWMSFGKEIARKLPEPLLKTLNRDETCAAKTPPIE